VKWSRGLLALCAWLHFALVVWVCFLLPTHGNWMHKIEAASSSPLLLPLMAATLASGWLSRDSRLALLTAVVLATLDALLWAVAVGCDDLTGC